MQLAAEVFRRLEIPIVLRWNNRGFLGELLGAMGLPAELSPSVMLTLDKLDKIGREGVSKELADKVIDPEICRRILSFVDLKEPTFEQITRTYNLEPGRGAREVQILQSLLQRVGLQDICVFDPFLSRACRFIREPFTKFTTRPMLFVQAWAEAADMTRSSGSLLDGKIWHIRR